MEVNCRRCLTSVAIPSRLKIIEFLKDKDKEVTVTDVVGILHLRQPTVTFHIKKLVNAGIISKRKLGRESLLKINLLSPKCQSCPVFN